MSEEATRWRAAAAPSTTGSPWPTRIVLGPRAGELAHRLRGRVHVLGELRVGPGQASWVGQGVPGEQDAGVRVEDGQVAGGVARRCDDLEAEHLIAVAEGAQRLWGIDLGKVVCPDVARRTRCIGQDLTDAAGVVTVLVGQHHMPDACPAGSRAVQDGSDRIGAPGDARVDHRGLTTPNQDVGRHEPEVDTRPGQRFGRGPSRGSARDRCRGLRRCHWMFRALFRRSRNRRSRTRQHPGRRCPRHRDPPARGAIDDSPGHATGRPWADDVPRPDIRQGASPGPGGLTMDAGPRPPVAKPERRTPEPTHEGPGVLRHHMVGLTGFEPAASSSRTRRATKLRHSPIAGPGTAKPGDKHGRAYRVAQAA